MGTDCFLIIHCMWNTLVTIKKLFVACFSLPVGNKITRYFLLFSWIQSANGIKLLNWEKLQLGDLLIVFDRELI